LLVAATAHHREAGDHIHGGRLRAPPAEGAFAAAVADAAAFAAAVAEGGEVAPRGGAVARAAAPGTAAPEAPAAGPVRFAGGAAVVARAGGRARAARCPVGGAVALGVPARRRQADRAAVAHVRRRHVAIAQERGARLRERPDQPCRA